MDVLPLGEVVSLAGHNPSDFSDTMWVELPLVDKVAIAFKTAVAHLHAEHETISVVCAHANRSELVVRLKSVDLVKVVELRARDGSKPFRFEEALDGLLLSHGQR